MRFFSVLRRVLLAAVPLLWLGGDPIAGAAEATGAAKPGKKQSKAKGKPSGLPDLTKATPAKTANSYNLGPTGALGWM